MIGQSKELVEFKQQLAGKDVETQLLNYLGQDPVRTRKMQTAVMVSVQKVPELLKCDRQSMLQAVIACAEFNLYPSAISGDAFILPYKGKAQFQLGYKGKIKLLYRAGIEAVDTNIVYKNDIFEYEAGLNPKLEHIPVKFGDDRGEPIGVYAIAVVNGQKLFKAMSKDQVMEFKKLSKSAGSDYSPWKSNDPELWMWRKTAIGQLEKTLPKDELLERAIALDNEDSIVADIPNRRTIDTAALKQDAPTMGTLKANAEKPDEKKKSGLSKEEAADDDLFAGSATGE